MRHRPSVIVIGAGFAGLAAVRALAHSDANVTLLDRKNHHCFQPLLYQVATAALSPADVAWPIRSIVAGQHNATVIMDDVTAIDTTMSYVVTASGLKLAFDYLVIATGGTTSYFSRPDWAMSAPGLKTIEDATRIRAQILLAFERAERSGSEADRKRLLTFVVVGGGPTGVELAGSIADVARNVLARDFRHIDPASARIILVEAGKRLLSTFPEELSDYTKRSLSRMGVEILTDAFVTDCDARGVSISGDRQIESACILWAAGVRASPAAEWLGIESDRVGRVPVSPYLKVAKFSHIFAVGDTASVISCGKAVPGLAPAAKQMGRYVGKYIAKEILGKTNRLPPFRYRHQGDLATIGRRSAVVSFGKLQLTGFFGWLFWSAAHIYFLIGVRNRTVVAVNWIWEYITFQRGARLIT
jgi:NADH:quinone reductase (non-electrogenic)